MRVTAAQLQHRVPCWGYVFREAPIPPRELPGKVQAAGLQPGDALAMLKQGLKPSSTVQTTSGETLPLLSLFSPPAPGRKVVLLGDTCDSAPIEGMLFIQSTAHGVCLRTLHLEKLQGACGGHFMFILSHVLSSVREIKQVSLMTFSTAVDIVPPLMLYHHLSSAISGSKWNSMT